MHDRRGYVLIVVLWTLVGVAAIAGAASVIARESIGTSANRIAMLRTGWLAEGCANRALHVIESALGESSGGGAWLNLDSVEGLELPHCAMSLRPVGMRADVNRATEAELVQLAYAAGARVSQAESLAAAILDWRDDDDDARPHGAERRWYRSAHRVEPSNQPFRSTNELLFVRGVEAIPRLDTLLDVEDDPLLLSRAPFAVLAAVPGLGPDAAEIIVDGRNGRGIADLSDVVERLSGDQRNNLAIALPRLVGRTTWTPTAWLMTVTARDGIRGVVSNLELRLVRDDERIAIVRKRVWP